MAKTILHFDPTRAAAGPRRLTLPDAVASAFVRAGIAAAADPADAGALAAGGALAGDTPTTIVVEHGQPGATRLSRVSVPLAVAQVAVAAGIAAGVAAPIVGGGTPTPTLGTVTLTGSLMQGVAASGVSISGATDGSTIAFNIAGLSVGTSGTTRTVSGTPATFGVLTYAETLAGATGSPKTGSLGNVAALPAPLAPTVAAVNGNNEGQLLITDNGSSQGVQKWGIYKLPSSGGTPAFLTWAYNRDWRRALTNGAAAEIYRVSAANASGESPLSPEVSISASATAFNALRLVATTLAAGELFYEMIAPNFRTGSTVAVASSEGNALSTKTKNGAIIVYGTTPAGADRDITFTFTETPSGGGTPNVSTQTIRVANTAFATYASAKSNAQALKARIDNKPTYTDVSTIVLTDMGGTMPAGYTGNYAVGDYAGGSPPAGSYANVSSFAPPPNYINIRGWDPVEKRVNPNGEYIGLGTSNNTVLRMRIFKQTFVIAFQDTATVNYAVNAVIRYSDDAMASFSEMAKPLLHRAGTKFYKVDMGSVPPAGGRVVEVELSVYGQLANFSYAPGIGFEAGETPQIVADTSPTLICGQDSFAAMAGGWNSTKSAPRQAARRTGKVNVWNAAANQQRYTDPYSFDTALGLNRVGENVLGLGDVSNAPSGVGTISYNVTINDFAQTDYTQAQAMVRNFLLRNRRLRPNWPIVLSCGFWAPQDRIPTAVYNAIKAAADSFAAQDKAFRFNDGVAAGWAVAAGATGSSPYFFATNGGNVSGSSSGTTLTVTAGSGIELGMYVFSGSTYTKAQVVEQLSGTTGGAGTYRLSNIPTTGDFASGATITLNSEDFTTTRPIHPTQTAGYPWIGQMMADGETALIADILANAP